MTSTPIIARRAACGALALALALPAAPSEADKARPTLPFGLSLPNLPFSLPLPGQQQPAAEQPAAQQPEEQPQSRSTAVLSPAEKQMREDKDRFNKTVFGGVVMGAVIGAGTGLAYSMITGQDSKKRNKTVLVTTAAGAVAGGVDGYVTAKKEQAGRQQVRELQAATEDVRQDNEHLQAFIDSTDSVLAEGRARLAGLSRDVASKRISAKDAEQARQREQQNIDEMRTTLESAKKSREQYQQAATKLHGTPQERRDLDAEIRKMNKEVAQLEGNIAEYSHALQVSKA
jgi:uncharacterized protein YcfJ